MLLENCRSVIDILSISFVVRFCVLYFNALNTEIIILLLKSIEISEL